MSSDDVMLKKMKLQLPIIIIIIFTNISLALAQCNEDSLMAIKGTWKKKNGYITDAFKSQQPFLRMDKWLKLLQSAYRPEGMEAIWSFNTGRSESLVRNGPYTYTLTAGFMEYFCFTYQNKTDLKLAFETGNWFYIMANAFGSFMKEDRDFKIENKKVYLLTPKLFELNGYSVYAGEDGNDLLGRKKFSRTILITRPGQLPYTPVTRKQYLMAFLQYEEEFFKTNVAMELKKPVLTDAEEQIIWQKGYDEIANLKTNNEKAREQLLSRYKRNYVTSKQERQNAINRMESIYQTDTKTAKVFLTNETEEELAKPAILNSSYPKGDFKQFVPEDKGNMMVQINEKYFDSQLPSYMPQFLVVYWVWGTHKAAVNFGTRVEKNFDLDTLQQMLDK